MTTNWESPAETLGEHIERLALIESEADVLNSWQPLLIPGVLQSFAYACEAIRSTSPALPAETIGERAEGRQQRIDQLRASMEFIVDESALRRPVGGLASHVDQLEHLQTVEALQPRVTLRILPQDSEAHPGLAGPFTMYRAGDKRAVFVETLTSSDISTRPDDLAAYASAWERLDKLALSPRRSLDLIESTRERLCRRLKPGR